MDMSVTFDFDVDSLRVRMTLFVFSGTCVSSAVRAAVDIVKHEGTVAGNFLTSACRKKLPVCRCELTIVIDSDGGYE